jgi:hypothetical protein
MYEFITPGELGLDKNDFDFEILESEIVDTASFRPRQILKVKINNIIVNLDTPYIGKLDYLKNSFWGYKQKDIDRLENNYWDSIKFEAMLKCVNTKQFQRKLKLEKINKLNGN